MISTEFFIVMDPDPNIYASTKFCLFLKKIIGDLLQKRKMPVWDRLVSVSTSWFASTIQCDKMQLPLGTRFFPGID